MKKKFWLFEQEQIATFRLPVFGFSFLGSSASKLDVGAQDREHNCASQSIALEFQRPFYAVVSQNASRSQDTFQLRRGNLDFQANTRKALTNIALDCLLDGSDFWQATVLHFSISTQHTG